VAQLFSLGVMSIPTRIILFGVSSGLLWSSAPIYFSNRSREVFVISAIAGIIAGLLVSFALCKPLSRFNRRGTFFLGILALPLGAFCFGMSFGVVSLLVGYSDTSVTSVGNALVAPLYFGVFYAYMAIVASCASYFGFISIPSALLTTYLLRLIVLNKKNPQKPK